MIGRHGLIAGIFGVVIYLSLYLAYAVVDGWDVPLWLVGILGVVVFLGAGFGTHLVITNLERQARQTHDEEDA